MGTKTFHEPKERGIARSDITHMTICMLSGVKMMKSQKLSWLDWAWGKRSQALPSTAWIRSGN